MISNTLVSVASPFVKAAVNVTTVSAAGLVYAPSLPNTSGCDDVHTTVVPFANVTGNDNDSNVVAGNSNNCLSNANSSASVKIGDSPSATCAAAWIPIAPLFDL